ncbi:MAG: RsbRD N-terminal domain-containing protein [Streptosporangiales bacterium]
MHSEIQAWMAARGNPNGMPVEWIMPPYGAYGRETWPRRLSEFPGPPPPTCADRLLCERGGGCRAHVLFGAEHLPSPTDSRGRLITMEIDRNQGLMGTFMRDHQEKIIGRWRELVVAGVRGRISAAEVRHELEDLYSLVLRAMSGVDEQAAGELRAALDELSRSRARNGSWPCPMARPAARRPPRSVRCRGSAAVPPRSRMRSWLRCFRPVRPARRR